ncbi:GFA family protein [Paucibacter sp. APW11]|uniref:GFA family protein n=1 Tax=Roseateles aquae TaxID=3077235 RepID=A0ABU3PGK5_9BURK|nr:GFA family protein [Paucibacter sp. APW11]MDT9001659.1 GFA family protein [Paucibacter sp. APW11]
MSHRKGACLCGAVSYTLSGEPRAIALCHCSHCKKQSGSAFSFNLVVRESDYQQSGDTTVYLDTGDSGEPVHRHFCAKCGSPLFARIAAAPGKVILKAGTLDSLEGLRPLAEIYTAQAVPWLDAVEGAQRFPQNQ